MSRTLEVYSDFVCPWCWVGRRRLEGALALLQAAAPFELEYRAFELNPAMPPEGMARRDYRVAKFGSWEHSRALDAQLVAVGEAEGLAFDYERIERTPSTFAAHRLMKLAAQEGDAPALAELLFRAYFEHGQDIGDPAVLARLAARAGIEAERATEHLAEDAAADAVRADEACAARLGIGSVPTFVHAGRPIASGALEPTALAQLLGRLA